MNQLDKLRDFFNESKKDTYFLVVVAPMIGIFALTLRVLFEMKFEVAWLNSLGTIFGVAFCSLLLYTLHRYVRIITAYKFYAAGTKDGRAECAGESKPFPEDRGHREGCLHICRIGNFVYFYASMDNARPKWFHAPVDICNGWQEYAGKELPPGKLQHCFATRGKLGAIMFG